MANLSFLLRQLQPFVLFQRGIEDREDYPDCVELFTGQERLSTDRIYLAYGPDIGRLTQAATEEGAAVIVAEADPTRRDFTPPQGAAFAALACSLPRLHNALSAQISARLRWQEAFQSLIESGGGLHDMLNLTGRLAGGAVVLLDSKGQVMAGSGVESGSFLAGQLSQSGVFPRATLESIFPHESAVTGEFSVAGTALTILGRKNIVRGETVGILLLEKREDRSGENLGALCALLSEMLRRRLFCNEQERIGSGSRQFQKCWEEIMERHLGSSEEIRSALNRLPYPVEQFVCVAVISFRNESRAVPFNYLITRLREIFPNTNVAFYRKDIVLLPSFAQRTFRPTLADEDHRRLTELLEQYDGALMFGNGTRNLDALPSIFSLTRRTLMLTQKLFQGQKGRVLYYEDNCIYSVIDLAVQRYLDGDGNRDVIYMTHPAIVQLTRYDRENNTQLRDVLYYYLLHDRNIVKTAAILYMHRNTVLNKINKAIAITGVDLEDVQLRQRLIFSCQFIKYYETILQLDIRP